MGKLMYYKIFQRKILIALPHSIFRHDTRVVSFMINLVKNMYFIMRDGKDYIRLTIVLYIYRYRFTSEKDWLHHGRKKSKQTLL
jgi:hypothetical protein